jgi:hypothetical protein
MSDVAVNGLILEMEKYLKDTEALDLDYVSGWNQRFGAARDAAERGPGWQETVERAHALGEVIQKRIGGLGFEQEQLKRELNVQALGQRALKGYSSGTR